MIKDIPIIYQVNAIKRHCRKSTQHFVMDTIPVEIPEIEAEFFLESDIDRMPDIQKSGDMFLYGLGNYRGVLDIRSLDEWKKDVDGQDTFYRGSGFHILYDSFPHAVDGDLILSSNSSGIPIQTDTSNFRKILSDNRSNIISRTLKDASTLRIVNGSLYHMSESEPCVYISCNQGIYELDGFKMLNQINEDALYDRPLKLPISLYPALKDVISETIIGNLATIDGMKPNIELFRQNLLEKIRSTMTDLMRRNPPLFFSRQEIIDKLSDFHMKNTSLDNVMDIMKPIYEWIEKEVGDINKVDFPMILDAEHLPKLIDTLKKYEQDKILNHSNTLTT